MTLIYKQTRGEKARVVTTIGRVRGALKVNRGSCSSYRKGPRWQRRGANEACLVPLFVDGRRLPMHASASSMGWLQLVRVTLLEERRSAGGSDAAIKDEFSKAEILLQQASCSRFGDALDVRLETRLSLDASQHRRDEQGVAGVV